MNNTSDNEREKLLLHSLKDVVLEEKTKLQTLQTTVNSLPSVPTKTSDLTNDSGFLTAHQDISGKENTANKTTSIRANPDDTKYPTEKAVADYVADSLENVSGGSSVATTTTLDENSTDANVPTSKAVVDYVNDNIPQNYDTVQNMQIAEIQTQIQNLGGTILLNQPEVADRTRLTTVAEISALNNQFDTTNFNTETHEKLSFASKGSTGPNAVVYFRQAYGITLTPTITLQFFLRDIPSGTTSLACNILLNDTTISSTALTVVSDQTYQATITLSNLTTDSFNKLEINFNDSSLATMQLDYLDISISNTQNCIILNRDDSFSYEGLIKTDGDTFSMASNLINGVYKYQFGTNLTFQDILSPSTSVAFQTDSNGNNINLVNAYLTTCIIAGNYITFSAYIREYLLVLLSNNGDLYQSYVDTTSMQIVTDNVLQYSISIHNKELERCQNLVSCLALVKRNFQPLITHVELRAYNYIPTLNSTNLPNEFVEACGIKDWFMRLRTVHVEDIGYFFVHKSGAILFFPRINNTYCIKVGMGKQVNAYLSEDALSISVYYNLDNKVIKKTLRRTVVEDYSTWELDSNDVEYQNTKDLRETSNSYIYLDTNLTWNQGT